MLFRSLELLILGDSKNYDNNLLQVIKKLCNLDAISFVGSKQDGAASFMIGTEQYFIPLKGKLDTAAEIMKLNEDLAYNKGFLSSVMKKLDNERFVKNAPANVLDLERRKKSDAESKIKSLEERIRELEKLS